MDKIPQQLRPWFKKQQRKALTFVFVGIMVALVSLIRLRFPFGPIVALIAILFSTYGYINYRAWRI